MYRMQAIQGSRIMPSCQVVCTVGNWRSLNFSISHVQAQTYNIPR